MTTPGAQPEPDSLTVTDEDLAAHVLRGRRWNDGPLRAADVIAAAGVLELKRRNDLYLRKGEVLDAQMASLDRRLETLAAAVERVAREH